MNNLYWIGNRESEIKYCNNLFKDNINIFGNNIKSLRIKQKENINHNNPKNYNKMNKFIIDEIKSIIEKDPQAKFMCYSNIINYNCLKKNNLLNYIICINDYNLLKLCNDKFKIKKTLKNKIPTLEDIFLYKKNITIKLLEEKFNNDTFIVQSKYGSGGDSTNILTKQNFEEIMNRLNLKDKYMVTSYCKNNIPINIHLLISKDNIVILPGSVQIIIEENYKMKYKGCDFIYYNKLSNELKEKHFKYSKIIGEFLQSKGYRGIFGIDSIIFNNEIYFIEINSRFQNSSTILNKGLVENNYKSLQELQLDSFNNNLTIDIKNIKINYSCFINEDKNNNKKEKESIEILDPINDKLTIEQSSYIESYIYNHSIYNDCN